MTTTTFTIPGKPCGKGRPRATSRGKFIKLYSPKETVNYETLVKMAFIESLHGASWPVTTQPFRIHITAYYQRPASHYGTGRNTGTLKASAPKYPTVKPDAGNIEKIITDALNTVAYKDDSQGIEETITKEYATGDNGACVVVTIEMIEE